MAGPTPVLRVLESDVDLSCGMGSEIIRCRLSSHDVLGEQEGRLRLMGWMNLRGKQTSTMKVKVRHPSVSFTHRHFAPNCSRATLCTSKDGGRRESSQRHAWTNRMGNVMGKTSRGSYLVDVGKRTRCENSALLAELCDYFEGKKRRAEKLEDSVL